MKFIYWFAYYNTYSPSVRYRGQYPLEYLKRYHGINSYFVTPGYRPYKIYNFIRVYFSALFFTRPDSLIVIQRINSNFIYANLLKLLIKIRSKHTVYDLDDADYLDFKPDTIHYFIKNCNALMVGSNELMKNLAGLNSRIFINTSPVPDLGITKNIKNDLLTIGWIGEFGGGHKISLLKYFFPALKDLPFKVKLVLLGVSDKNNYEYLKKYFAEFENVILEMPFEIDWKNERSIQERIAKFDIGIATLLNTEAQRSKSAFKLKQYMNNGVPVMSSDVAENNHFIREGVNGYLCRTSADFTKRILEIHFMDVHAYSKLSAGATVSIHTFNHVTYCNTLFKIFSSSNQLHSAGSALELDKIV